MRIFVATTAAGVAGGVAANRIGATGAIACTLALAGAVKLVRR